MNDIALVLCSFNSKNDTLNCIESIYKSSIQNFDLIVVDNASSDGVSDEIKSIYGDKIYLIINLVNNGAGAGFNTGIKYALKNEYKYIMTIDHDVLLEKDTIKVLYDFLNQNIDVGIAGSKFCYMDRPNIIQWFDRNMDYDIFKFVGKYTNHEDNGNIPNICYCESAILGAMMTRREAIEGAGLLDETLFIYDEDIEWCYRIRQQGYKIAICSKSKVLHRYGMSVTSKRNTFATYYHRRNVFRVILKMIPEHLIPKYCEVILRDLFEGLYSCNYLKKHNVMKTLMFSIDDAINDNFGKAGEGRIFELDNVENRFKSTIEDWGTIVLKCNNTETIKLSEIRNLHTHIMRLSPNAKIYLSTNCEEIILNISDVGFIDEDAIKELDWCLVLNVCEHIFRVGQFEQNQIYVDSFLNVVADEKDKQYCLQFDANYEFFYNACFHTFLSKAKWLRKKNGIDLHKL